MDTARALAKELSISVTEMDAIVVRDEKGRFSDQGISNLSKEVGKSIGYVSSMLSLLEEKGEVAFALIA